MDKDFSKGLKYDDGKDMWDLLPVDSLREIVKVLTHGSRKYSPRNWELGLEYNRPYGAALRHLTSFWEGEDLDDETGLEHLAHAACCILFLLSFQLREMKKFDNRPIITKGTDE